MTNVHPLGGAIRVMIIGALAAGCAFGVAKLIQH
jgi:ABC-type Co2+ transport system permease subunit